MVMRTLANAWNRMQKINIDDEASAEDCEILRRTFYAGAIAFADIMLDCNEDISKEERADQITGLMKECMRFAAEILVEEPCEGPTQ